MFVWEDSFQESWFILVVGCWVGFLMWRLLFWRDSQAAFVSQEDRGHCVQYNKGVIGFVLLYVLVFFVEIYFFDLSCSHQSNCLVSSKPLAAGVECFYKSGEEQLVISTAVKPAVEALETYWLFSLTDATSVSIPGLFHHADLPWVSVTVCPFPCSLAQDSLWDTWRTLLASILSVTLSFSATTLPSITGLTLCENLPCVTSWTELEPRSSDRRAHAHRQAPSPGLSWCD